MSVKFKGSARIIIKMENIYYSAFNDNVEHNCHLPAGTA
jgi:hypothetical protein